MNPPLQLPSLPLLSRTALLFNGDDPAPLQAASSCTLWGDQLVITLDNGPRLGLMNLKSGSLDVLELEGLDAAARISASVLLPDDRLLLVGDGSNSASKVMGAVERDSNTVLPQLKRDTSNPV